MPSYDPGASRAPLLARLVVRHRARHRGHGAPRLRPPAHALRRAGLAGDVLHDRDGALAHERDGQKAGDRVDDALGDDKTLGEEAGRESREKVDKAVDELRK
jgi:hypothetical protein